MFGVNWMELLILIGTIGVGSAVLAYLVLRLFVWSKAESQSLERIRRHALWTGVIAWAFSSLAGAGRAGIYDPDRYHPDHWSTVPWLAVIAPSVAVLAVHAIGQSTWPAPKSPKRSAVLEFRRTRDYIEPALGWTVATIFTLTAVVVGFLFFAPELMGPNSVTLGDYGQSIQTRFGRTPGYVLATALGVALTILVLGTATVMRLIASRRSLEALSVEQNKTLRTIGMNRLLRVSATVASGLAAIAGNYLAQPAPDSTATSWVNWLAIVNMLVLIAMLLWKPPFLDSPTHDAGYNTLFNGGASPDPASDSGPAAAKLSDAAGLLAPASGAVGLVAGWLAVPWFGWLGPLTLMVVFVLLSHLGLELLLRNNYAAPGTPRTRLKAAVPRSLPILAGVAGMGLIPTITATTSLNRGGVFDWPGFGGSSPHFLVPLICVLAILTAGAGATAVVLSRPGLNDASELLDRTLRRRSLFRIARTVAGGLFAILAAALVNLGTAPTYGGQSADQSLAMVGGACIIAAVALCCYPVRAFTPADFMPPAKTTTSLGK